MAAKAERKKRVVDVEARLFLDSIFSKVEDFAIVLEEALLVFFCAFAPNAASARSNNDLLDFFFAVPENEFVLYTGRDAGDKIVFARVVCVRGGRRDANGFGVFAKEPR
jgi:hypothetical protein